MITYHEDGSVYEVEVLEDNSNDDWAKYRLKILTVLNFSPLCPGKVGEVYEVEQKKGCAFGGMWHLNGYTPEQEQNQ